MEIAEWLKPLLNSNCPYCGAEIVNNENLTDRYCSNPRCDGHMAYKVSELATRLGIKGIGPSTALSYIQLYHHPFHICYLPIMMAEKPKLYLWQVGELALIKGVQKQWKDICYGKSSMREVCDDPATPATVRQNKALLLACETYFDVIKPLLGERVFVMMSGSFEGYRSRSDFIDEMNSKYGDKVQLIDVGKRKTGVDYLIKEEWATDHEKSAIAHAYSIPIVTPARMKEILDGAVAYISEGGIQP